MNGVGVVVAVIGLVIVLLGLVQHFAKVAILGGVSHGSAILIVVGIIVAVVGYALGRTRRAVV